MENHNKNLINESQFCNVCGNLKENCVCESKEDESLKDSKEQNKCPYCGAETESDWKSCGMCGEVLVEVNPEDLVKLVELKKTLEQQRLLERPVDIDRLKSIFSSGDITEQELYLPVVDKMIETGNQDAVIILDVLLRSHLDSMKQTGIALFQKMIDTPGFDSEIIEKIFLFNISAKKEFWQDSTVQSLLADFFKKRGSLSEHTFESFNFSHSEGKKDSYISDQEKTDKLFNIFKETDVPGMRSQIIALLQNESPELTQEYMREEMAKIGLDWNHLITVWHSKDRFEIFDIYRNLLIILELEKQRPGSAETLSKEFGIEFFGRYPLEMLIAQYDQRKDDIPYGIIMYPKADHNGAFYNDKKVFSEMHESLSEDGVGVRVAEADNKIGLLRQLVRLDRKYGQSHKISFAIIGGHGTVGSITFGKLSGSMGDSFSSPLTKEEKERRRTDRAKWDFTKKNSALVIEDLASGGVSRTKSFFTEHPSIVLSSCSTGAREGIGQKMSELLGAELMAPETPSAVYKITPKVDTSGVHLEALFLDNAGKSYNQGK